jgi:hypothetical protein
MIEDRRITKTKTAIREAFISIIKKKMHPKLLLQKLQNRPILTGRPFTCTMTL